MTGTPSWSVIDQEFMIRLWKEGYSATYISEQIPGKTRNAVMGKVRRLGLHRLDPDAPRVPRKPRQRKEPKVMIPEPPSIPKPEPPKAPFVPFMEANQKTCRSIEGHDGTLALFCSNPKIPEESYCVYHQHIFYQPITRR